MRRVDRNRVPSYCSCGRSFRGPGPRANHGRLIGHSWIAAEEFKKRFPEATIASAVQFTLDEMGTAFPSPKEKK